MSKVKSIKSAQLFPAISELLQNNQRVRIRVTGDSMMPFLRADTDSVELSAVSFKDLRLGQITLIKRTTGQYILHRLVYKKKDCFYIAGDAQSRVEGPLLPGQLVAVVSNIWRGDKLISQSNIFRRLLLFFWWLRLPIRYVLMKIYRFLHPHYKTIRRR
jgi:hypothetical protein